jgi:hypothetical protein
MTETVTFDAAVLKAKLVTARAELERAEVGLREALDEVAAAPRAEKTTIPAGLHEAFDRTVAAREVLVQLEEMIVGRK